MRKFVYIVLVGLALAPWAVSGDEGYGDLERALEKVVPGRAPDRIAPSPVPGLLEVRYGAQLFYATRNGRFVIQGNIYDLKNGQNLTAPRLADARAKAIEALGEANMIVFSPPEPAHTVTVFTDIDCPYCQRLHQQIDEYNARGIKVRYVLYPRARVGEPSYNKAVSVWCAEDRAQALTKAKSGEPVAERRCANPVQRNMELGRTLGITGTPTIVTPQGKIIPGYVSPERLTAILESGLQRNAKLDRASESDDTRRKPAVSAGPETSAADND